MLRSLARRTLAPRQALHPVVRPAPSNLRSFPSPLRPTLRARTLPKPPLIPQTRQFHPSPRRDDILFVSLPALKGALLNITRFSLLFFPFIIRYKIWRKYKRLSILFLQIPIFALCVILAIGLDQSPRTGRWRLLLMGEHEEMAWSRRKQKDILKQDGPNLLPPSDPRSQKVSRITARLITALEEQDRHIVCGANWPPASQELSRVMSQREAMLSGGAEGGGGDRWYEPSGTAKSGYLPYRPESRNPLKKVESGDWRLYVIDSPDINAFALPSKDIFIYTGLLHTLPPDDDTILAASIAHELAHVIQRHSVENLGFMNIATVLFDVVRGFTFAFTISFPFITDSAGMFINYINTVLTERAYSRKLEMEADAVGLQIMASAGYNPRAAQDLWQLMRCVEEDAAASGQMGSMENRFSMLRTHPTSDVRHEALEKDMPGAMKVYREFLKKNGLVRVKEGVPEQKKEGEREEVPDGAESVA
ncbi:hypothetical protein I350_07152 [Cryptococcus amylolentus CBS 6273]|uniref:Peptidase M48 domain-containing protein n=1 Tax=Cryptococcus amylolentus CBS 6273 TaxID=1296118 RepID=A0A1E3JDP5_9TREE|nr:hypothetical protein I350_07152 [Cryptococcus amylolentus CBS 6273]